MTAAAGFGDRLSEAIEEHGGLCVGIDPHPPLLQAWALPDDASGVREFGLRVVDALAGHVAAIKPQSAFFERHGSRGVGALEDVLAAARASGVLTILDVKRGDIGSTMAGYADAYLGEGPLAADAITLSPYLGFGSLGPALDLAQAGGRGVFVLAVTSNPEAGQVQLARDPSGRSVAAGIVAAAHERNVNGWPAALGGVGLVVGATQAELLRAAGVDLSAFTGPVLLPGVGAQGGDLDAACAVIGLQPRLALASTSRQVLAAGPDADALRRAAVALAGPVEKTRG